MLLIDKAKKEEIDSIHSISQELNIKNAEDKDKGVLLRVIPKEVIEENIENFIVARYDSKVVGFLWFTSKYPKAMLENTILQENIEGCIYSEQIGIKREYEGRGIGRKLYEHLKSLYPENGILVFVNTAPQGNKASFSFHTSLGFRTVGIFHKEYFCGFENFTSNLLKMDKETLFTII